MNQGESITSYLMRITKLRNQLANIGHAYYEKELSMIILNGLPLSLDSFIQGISARPKLPKFDRLKIDCLQEELRLISRGTNFKEDLKVLYSQSYKGNKYDHQPRNKRKIDFQDKGERNFRDKRGTDYQNRKEGNSHDKGGRGRDYKNKKFHKRDISEIQCFRCDKFGHMAIHCPEQIKLQASIAEVKESESEHLVF